MSEHFPTYYKGSGLNKELEERLMSIDTSKHDSSLELALTQLYEKGYTGAGISLMNYYMNEGRDLALNGRKGLAKGKAKQAEEIYAKIIKTYGTDNSTAADQAKVGMPDSSHILYDGKEHALFYHHGNEMFILDFLPEEVRPLIAKTDKIKIKETLSDYQTVVREYEVPIKHVESYPIVLSEYLKTADDYK